MISCHNNINGMPKTTNQRIIKDKQQYFTDRDNIKACFPPILVGVWSKLDKDVQRDLMTQRRTIISDQKKCGMKNMLSDLMNEVNRKKQR